MAATLNALIIPVTPFQQNCTVMFDTETKHGVVVDPGGDIDHIREALEKNDIIFEAIWLTHGHIDHAGGAAELKERLGVPVEGPHEADRFLLDSLPDEAIHLLHYEALLADPEGAVAALCAFLGEDFEPGMLQFFKGREAKKSAQLSESWGNTGKPVLTSNAGKFHKELSEEDTLAVEAICRTPMAALGYAPTFPPQDLEAWHIGPVTRARIRVPSAVCSSARISPSSSRL